MEAALQFLDRPVRDVTSEELVRCLNEFQSNARIVKKGLAKVCEVAEQDDRGAELERARMVSCIMHVMKSNEENVEVLSEAVKALGKVEESLRDVEMVAGMEDLSTDSWDRELLDRIVKRHFTSMRSFQAESMLFESLLRLPFGQEAVMKIIANWMRDHKGDVSAQCEALDRLCEISPKELNYELLPLVVGAMQDHLDSSKLQGLVYHIFVETVHALDSWTFLRKSDVLTTILQSMQKYPSDERVIEHGCKCVLELIEDKSKMIDTDLADIIKKLVSNPSVTGKAIGGLVNLITDKAFKMKVVEIGVGKAIVKRICAEGVDEAIVVACFKFFRKVLTLNASWKDRVLADGMTSAVLQAMKKFRDHRSIQFEGLKVFRGCKGGKYQEILVDAGVPKHVIESMTFHPRDESIQESACILLSLLMGKLEKERRRTQFISLGVADRIMDLVRHFLTEEKASDEVEDNHWLLKASFILWDDESDVSKTFFETALTSLENPTLNVDSHIRSTLAIAACAIGGQTCRNVRACEAVMKMMRKYPKEAEVQLNGCLALRFLGNGQGVDVPRVFDQMFMSMNSHIENEQVQFAAARALLATYKQYKSATTQQVFDDSRIDQMIQLLVKHGSNEALQLQLLRLFRTVLDGGLEVRSKKELLDQICATLVRFETNQMICRMGCQILDILPVDGGTGEVLFTSKAILVVASTLRERMGGLKALSKLAREKDAFRSLMWQMKVVSAIAELLFQWKTGDVDDQMEVCAVLQVLTDTDENKAKSLLDDRILESLRRGLNYRTKKRVKVLQEILRLVYGLACASQHINKLTILLEPLKKCAEEYSSTNEIQVLILKILEQFSLDPLSMKAVLNSTILPSIWEIVERDPKNEEKQEVYLQVLANLVLQDEHTVDLEEIKGASHIETILSHFPGNNSIQLEGSMALRKLRQAPLFQTGELDLSMNWDQVETILKSKTDDPIILKSLEADRTMEYFVHSDPAKILAGMGEEKYNEMMTDQQQFSRRLILASALRMLKQLQQKRKADVDPNPTPSKKPILISEVLRKVRILDAKVKEVWGKHCVWLMRNLSYGVTRLESGNIHLDDDDMWLIGSTLKKQQCPSLKELLFGNNQITNGGLEDLATGLRAHKRCLRLLDLSNNKFDPTGARSLAQCMNHIQVLDVSGNRLGNDGLAAFATNLSAKMSQLHTLSLCNCNIDDLGVGQLCNAIQGNRSLDLVRLDGNGGITEKSINQILAIYNHPPPKKPVQLSLSNTGISKDSLNKLAHAFAVYERPLLFVSFPVGNAVFRELTSHFRVLDMTQLVQSCCEIDHQKMLLLKCLELGRPDSPMDLEQPTSSELLFYALFESFQRSTALFEFDKTVWDILEPTKGPSAETFWSWVGQLIHQFDDQINDTVFEENDLISLQMSLEKTQVYAINSKEESTDRVHISDVLVLPSENQQKRLSKIFPLQSLNMFFDQLSKKSSLLTWDLPFDSVWADSVFMEVSKHCQVAPSALYMSKQYTRFCKIIILEGEEEEEAKMATNFTPPNSDFVVLCQPSTALRFDWTKFEAHISDHELQYLDRLTFNHDNKTLQTHTSFYKLKST